MARFTINFLSYTLVRAVDITVIVPSVTCPEALGMQTPPRGVIQRPAEPYPVVYLLHGMANNHATWTAYTNVERYAEERNIAIVMISGENKSYVDVPGGDAFFRFIADELPQFVTGMLPLSRRPEDTYIAGLSMGGYGALLHGLSHPERYAAIGAFSAAVRLDPASLLAVRGGPDAPAPTLGASAGTVDPRLSPESLLDDLVERGGHVPPVYVSCGGTDMLIDDDRAFVQHLTNAGVAATWDTDPDRGHDWLFWDAQVRKFLDWLPRTDWYAEHYPSRMI